MDVEVEIGRFLCCSCFLLQRSVAAAMGVLAISVCLFFFAFSAAPKREKSCLRRGFLGILEEQLANWV